jgi:hypothetical protein
LPLAKTIHSQFAGRLMGQKGEAAGEKQYACL